MKIFIQKAVLLFGVLIGITLPGNGQKSQSTYDYNSIFKKGTAFVGLSGGANLRSSVNENALIVTIVDQDKFGYFVKATGGYFLKSDFAVGTSFEFNRKFLNKQTLDADNILSDVEEESAKYILGVYGKQFIHLFDTKRINFYNNFGLAWENDTKLNETRSQDVLTRTYTKTNAIRLGITPGVQVFIIEGFAIELGVNIAGATGGKTSVYVNDEFNSSVNTFKLDLKIDILTVNIGFFYYFNTGKGQVK